MADYLVVGCGFAGAVYARGLAEAGHRVRILEQRDHIGGNAYDYVDENGVRVHRYGPHLFHTSTERVVSWVKQFSAWVPYEHRVRALLPDGQFVPLPVNRDTINAVFGAALVSAPQVEAFLEDLSVECRSPANSGEYLNSKIGQRLTDLFFRPYTKKMWGLDLEDLAAAVVKRIPIRYDTDDRYFPNETFQALPADGYTQMFDRILDHANIDVHLSTTFTRGMEHEFRHCFSSMPIDEYFEFVRGELPYRSIRFHRETRSVVDVPLWGVTNFTDSGRYTRETYWKSLPGHQTGSSDVTTVTLEEPCDYRDNGMERYYPVKTADDRYVRLYGEYQGLADGLDQMTFIGRCGTYQYLDMDQVINQSLLGVEKFLRARGS
ncbi:UDP-galactopyranose/dTDP-fucopyranose mutase family protein [Chelatococcus reniformis]|uniref:UDP-galactopyranose mutase n=1 Tax=Chelatococcus reniformis TaxID=1494448 RepID=A0A916UZE0_9HYPH|nr:UDP-galactopyranose mutase [Chelatococcus reniformis]GGC94947.1 UDP-galactopyranose mutase [Chelatococcus reniformis]